jgi:hypothetical protein
MGGTAVPVMNWAFVPVDEQGVVLIANDLAGNLSLAGSGILAELKFDVVGELGDTSDIDFILPQCKLYDSGTPSGSQVDAGWVDDSVRVGGEATPTPTTTSNATATPTATATGGDEDSGSPGWLWPVIGIMIFLTLVFGGLALYKGGVLAKLGATWGATEEDFLVDDMSDEDLYDAMYGGEEEEEL